MKPLNDSERRLAQITAQLIAQAEKVGLPDPPDKLVTPLAIRLLSRSHLELLDQLRTIHDRVDQIARVAIEGALREVSRQQGGIATEQIVDEAKSEGMLAASPFMARLPRPPEITALSPTSTPRLVPTPVQVESMTGDQLAEIYLRVMGHRINFAQHETFIVRQWDGMDGCWTDCTGAVSRDEALRDWAERTLNGVRNVSYSEIDYYAIFPGDTHMLWDGSDGREMHR